MSIKVGLIRRKYIRVQNYTAWWHKNLHQMKHQHIHCLQYSQSIGDYKASTNSKAPTLPSSCMCAFLTSIWHQLNQTHSLNLVRCHTSSFYTKDRLLVPQPYSLATFTSKGTIPAHYVSLADKIVFPVFKNPLNPLLPYFCWHNASLKRPTDDVLWGAMKFKVNATIVIVSEQPNQQKQAILDL